MSAPQRSGRITTTLVGRCPECGRDENLLPGPIVDGMEQRRCEYRQHLVLTPSYVYCPPSESDTPGIV